MTREQQEAIVQGASERFLHREVSLSTYMSLFSGNEEESPEIQAYNRFLDLVLPIQNAGQKPGIQKLAAEAGLHPATAEELWVKVRGHAEMMKRGGF
jgi:hypothetical protein